MKYLLLFSVLFFYSCSNDIKEDIYIETQSERKVILALWDSLTAWYWVDQKDNYPTKLQNKLDLLGYDFDVINAWVSWDTSANILSRASLYLEKKPKIVILVAWWNDWLRWLSTVDLRSNLLKIIDIFSWSTVILWWMDIPANLWLNYRKDFKNVYKIISNENKNIYFFEYFLDWVWWIPRYNISDMIHPNTDWYEIIVNNLVNFLVKNDVLE